MASQAKETDGFRRDGRDMAAEDVEMFKSPRPYDDDSNATGTPKSTPPSSPAKTPEKEGLRPISMPEPFRI